jgi:hypothetical protein
MERTKMTMKAGKYYVGDLCYVMHDAWDEVCELVIADGKCIEGEFNLKDGRRFAMYNTAFGDGVYPSNVDAEFCVDSGSIGCILVDEIKDNTYSEERVSKLAAILEFDEDFRTFNDSGLLCFGEVEIDTDPVMDDYNYDDSND